MVPVQFSPGVKQASIETSAQRLELRGRRLKDKMRIKRMPIFLGEINMRERPQQRRTGSHRTDGTFVPSLSSEIS